MYDKAKSMKEVKMNPDTRSKLVTRMRGSVDVTKPACADEAAESRASRSSCQLLYRRVKICQYSEEIFEFRKTGV